MDPYDAIVVGVGSVGAAACRELARRGARVLGLERHGIPNARGSHHGSSRMIRTCYFEHPDYVALLLRAWRLWREDDERVGGGLLHQTGALYLGEEDGVLLGGCLAAAREHGLSHERLGREEVLRRHPQFAVPEGCAGLFEEQGGYVVPERAVALFAMDALVAGADLRGHEPALAWSAGGGEVVVRTSAGDYRASKLLLTAGAWNPALLAGLGLPLRVTRQLFHWVWPRNAGDYVEGRFPCWALDSALAGRPGGLYYGFPLLFDASGGAGLKVALHLPGPEVDPESDPRCPAEGEGAEHLAELCRFLPGVAGSLLASRTCHYTMSPDGHFFAGTLPGHPEVVVGAGMSGHGFKFAPVLGEALADLVLDGATALPIEFLSPDRVAPA